MPPTPVIDCVPVSDFDYGAARRFLRRREETRRAALRRRLQTARRDFDRIVAVAVEKYRPTRIYQWGSLLHPRTFSEWSDIDIAVEGIASSKEFLALYGEACELTGFELDLVQIEKVLLDPLVRLHSLDENSASDISSLLAFLRAINRRYQLALLLVHHMAKRSRRNLGQSLRGSSDLHAWTDSACYLVRRADDRLQLTVEHRCAPAPDPFLLRLSGGGEQPLSLIVDSAAAPPPPLAEVVRAALRSAGQPLSRTVLRQRLRVNNARLGLALQTLEQRGLAVRSTAGWHLPA